MSIHKKHKTTKADFKTFVQECKYVRSLLGEHGAPITYAHELPPMSDESYLAGSIQYQDSQKHLIYLSPEWPREVSDQKLKYLGFHEPVEMLLTRFLDFAERCVEEGKVDYEKWQPLVHDILNRFGMLYDADMMEDVAEDGVFAEEVGLDED